MPSTVSGDFSQYPASIREVFPMIYGEACELRQAYDVYFYLFMAKKERTELMGERLGGVLGIFQNLLQDEMFLSIARLTDRDSRMQKNVSLWSLLDAIPDAKDAAFGARVTAALDQIIKDADNLRTHRHKRIAHFDLNVSLSQTILPQVTFAEINCLIDRIALFANLFAHEFANATILFDFMESREITRPAEVACYKAVAYDLLESEGTIPKNEWRKRTGQ